MKDFNQFLEQYVFAVATQVIDQLDKPKQDQLIKLFARIDTAPLSTDESFPVDTRLALIETPDCPALVRKPALEKQPRKALRHSLDRQATRNDERHTRLQRLIAIHQGHIDSALANISRVKQLIQRAQQHIVSGDQRYSLLEHYQLLHDRYELYLAKMQTLQQKEINRLGIYQQQSA
ncbi:hypothetical protein [Spirosoma endbachense]|uniref:Uncharacterized protein n=1 Tax=Spirosoma endbachense TaxID=2666025 RepID=A0A6P1VWW0_9BACT|nr:hypothetical protein [Spirosoma endbachense]QHV96320.1 hypothetical protein GJR95_15405 [Spirosoma endbachense]